MDLWWVYYSFWTGVCWAWSDFLHDHAQFGFISNDLYLDGGSLLSITMETVSNPISNIFNKLQVADRPQAIFKARDAGLGKSEYN